MRLKQVDLKSIVQNMTIYTGVEFRCGNWNGYWHVYEAKTGEMLITGSLRECYNYVQAFIRGINYNGRWV